MEKLLPKPSNGDINFKTEPFAQENLLPIIVMVIVDGTIILSMY